MPSDFNPAEQRPTISVGELPKIFSKKVVDHILNPHNAGDMRGADGLGRASIPCGDSMQFCLRVRHDRVLESRFMTDGCGLVIACGSMLTELVKGETVNEAMAITEDDVISSLGGLPDSETHCATLAVNALKQALVDYLALRREPWKRAYRTVEPFMPGK